MTNKIDLVNLVDSSSKEAQALLLGLLLAPVTYSQEGNGKAKRTDALSELVDSGLVTCEKKVVTIYTYEANSKIREIICSQGSQTPQTTVPTLDSAPAAPKRVPPPLDDEGEEDQFNDVEYDSEDEDDEDEDGEDCVGTCCKDDDDDGE